MNSRGWIILALAAFGYLAWATRYDVHSCDQGFCWVLDRWAGKVKEMQAELVDLPARPAPAATSAPAAVDPAWDAALSPTR